MPSTAEAESREEDIKNAITDVVHDKLGGDVSVRVDLVEDHFLSDVIKIIVTIEQDRHLKNGGVFNLPNALREKLLSMHEMRFPLIHYQLVAR